MAKFNSLFLKLKILLIKFLVALLRGYRYFIGPLLGPACRFHPTCSRYAEEAIKKHPLSYALLIIVYRLLRCQPWCKGGEDPVPTASFYQKYK